MNLEYIFNFQNRDLELLAQVDELLKYYEHLYINFEIKNLTL